MDCVVAGAGYVGVSTAVVLAEKGHGVVLVDVDAAKLDALRRGNLPFREPGLEDALRVATKSGRLTFSARLEEACKVAEVILLCVGTPAAKDGSSDLSFVKAAASTIGKGVAKNRKQPTIIVKSTVPPGTVRDVVTPVLAKASRRTPGTDFHVAANPEFLREGQALADARSPSRLVVGADSAAGRGTVRRLWDYPSSVAVVETDPTTAELIKYASNAFLATKISFANELALLSARLGVDVYDVTHGMGLDPRIGPQFLRAGAGFGGSCFPKDVQALRALARRERVRLRFPDAVLAVNEQQPLEAIRLLRSALGALSGKTIALLGVAFKPDTDDVRESRAIPLYKALRKARAQVKVWDPVALANFRRVFPDAVGSADLHDVLTGADAALIQTEWPALKALEPKKWKGLMRRPIVVDGRRSVDAEALRRAGVEYAAIGAPTPRRASSSR